MTDRQSPLHAIAAFLDQYVVLTHREVFLPIALWVCGTYLWPHLDAYPYLVVRSDTKRSGKTRLGSDLLGMLVKSPRNFAGTTPAALFRAVKEQQPTLIIDEAETLSSEAANTMRAFLNVGYRRGQTIPRAAGKTLEEWPAYCPKVFISIGDVYDTLRDRSIIVSMQRAEPKRRFLFEVAKREAEFIRASVETAMADYEPLILDHYQRHPGLPFLTDRDEEVWLPLFAICGELDPASLPALERVAADLTAEKTADARRYVNLLGAERGAEDDEYARRLVRDLVLVCEDQDYIYTADALDRLKALPTGPWRRYRGEGLTPMELGALVLRFGLKPKSIRMRGTSGKRGGATVRRGYRREDLDRILKTL